ncbi:MAG: hypothetical protein KBT20_01005 [Bacteroidales bacterium]|nr:hypothetical protein [Candidatus Liminaster caballi]
MKKYVAPTINVVELEVEGLIALSGGGKHDSLPGNDNPGNNFAPSQRGGDWADYEQ